MQCNIERATIVSAIVWEIGGIPICPHTNSGSLYGKISEINVLAGYLQLLELADIVYCIDTKVYVEGKPVESTGTIAELRRAYALDKPVIMRNVPELIKMVIEWETPDDNSPS